MMVNHVKKVYLYVAWLQLTSVRSVYVDQKKIVSLILKLHDFKEFMMIVFNSQVLKLYDRFNMQLRASSIP
jgi:hypothetical protein